MHLTWKVFSGEIPRIEPHVLPDINAQVTNNLKVWTGGVESLKDATFTALSYKVGEKLTIYRDGQHIDSETKYWMTFTKDVDISRGPIIDDEVGRLYYTGDGVPKMTNSLIGWADPGAMPVVFYNLGIPAPTAPSVQVMGTPAADAIAATVLAAYAYVTADGFVGPLSPVSAPIDYKDQQELFVGQMQTGPSGAYNIVTKRVFVAQTDADGATAMRFWRDVALATPAVQAKVDFNLLGETAESPSLVAPDPALFGIMLHPNGFMVAFTKRKFCRSEVFKPHGWPIEYQDPLGDDIVGGAIINQTVIICTKGKTFAAIGSDPLNQQIQDLAGLQPCVSKRSIRAMPFGVLYAAPDGLIMAGGSGPLLVISEAHFTREQWQAFNPSSMYAATHDRRYYLWWKNGERKGLIIFEFQATGQIHLIVESDQWYSAAYADGNRDDLFVAASDGNIWKWDSGNLLASTWRSKEIRFDRPVNVGAVCIKADDYPVTFRLFERDVLVSEVEVRGPRPERLHCRDRYDRIHWEVETKNRYTQVEIASSIHELIKDG